ncbi:MAG: hypothetical protein GY953_33200, partial [bacterium]|nr:hypothetical protein [bacterium]
GRLSRQERATALAVTRFLYDGRSYLRLASGVTLHPPGPSEVFCDGFGSGDTTTWGSGSSLCPTVTAAEPTYSSEGLLHRVANAAESQDVFYFAGRPVAQVGSSGSLIYLTSDHLGTPILATDEAGSVEWQGGFEPFGADYSGASADGVFLSFPGQWHNTSWVQTGLSASAAYNVHRWFEPSLGRYLTPDPFRQAASGFEIGIVLQLDNLYGYVLQRPSIFVDPLGLIASNTEGCVTRLVAGGAAVGAGIGAAAGAAAGAAGAGTACTFVAPGVGTI